MTNATYTCKNGTEVFHAFYSFPQFTSTFTQSAAMNTFYLDKYFTDYKKIASLRDLAVTGTIPLNTSYAYDHTFEITYLSSNFISILENTYEYAGGAHPDSYYEAHTFSLNTGKQLSLSNLFLSSKANTEKTIKNFLIGEIHSKPDEYDSNAIDIVKNMPLESFHFYIKEGNVIIFFNPYEIAPYASGLVKFKYEL
ncbi:DUF3298 and DUF4163 domain-containing protein [[Clostridium] polysaccharolyticum]|uniref:DUF3298 and DUF4163 domain-containing protein n=1 Tax=[Clostridium] polysaccharolyticum TaxID=29364 RepID=UPI001FA87DA8|nr:DUF3298 and DUF4163 domain-containing protein [[Clostridium] polysaccharolyticum]